MLVNALMRTLLIEVISISRDDAVQLMLMKNEEVIGTFSFKRAYNSFAVGVI